MKNQIENEQDERANLSKKFGGIFLLFIVATIFTFFIFPEKLMGNIYVLTSYLIGCVFLLFVLYRYKKSVKNK